MIRSLLTKPRHGLALAMFIAGAAVLSPSCAKTVGGDDDGDGEDDDDDGGTGGICAKFEDASPSPVTVTWVNNVFDGRTIYIWGRSDDCVIRPDFDVYSESSELELDPQACVPTCGAYQEAPVACSGTCPDDPMIRIESGATHTFDWVPVHYKLDEMPDECWNDDQPTEGRPFCNTKAVIPEGSHQLIAEFYWDQLVKEPGAGSMEFGCGCADGSTSQVCDAVEGCSAEGSGATVEVTFDFDPSGSNAITIDVQI